MIWLTILPAILVAVAVFFLPGAAVAFALRLRGLRLVAFAPAVSASLIAVAALGSPFLGLQWGVIPVIALTVVATICAWLWTRYVGESRPAEPALRRDLLPVVIAVAVPALIVSFILVRSMHDPGYFSQRYDNFFHLNAVQYVLDTGNASPLWLGSMTSPEGVPFYPSAWHAFAALVVTLSGASVSMAGNAMILVIAAIIWPLGAVFLIRTLLGRSRVATVSVGVLSAAFPAFPLLPLHYGVLYPLFLGLALIPTAVAAAWMLLRPGRVRRRQDWAVLLVLAVPGVSVAHPGALMALIALSVPFVIARLTLGMRRATTLKSRLVPVALLVGYLGAGLVLLQVVRPPGSQIYWPVIQTVPGAIGEVVSAAVYSYPPALVVGALLVIGAYSVVRRGGYVRWVLLSMAAIGSVLYIIVAASPYEILRFWFTAPWYNNSPRLASMWVIAVLPLATLGASALVRWLVRVVGPLRRASGRMPIVVTAISAVVFVALTQGAAIRQAAADVEFTYQLRAGGPIISPDELALMEELEAIVPEDAVIAGDPWTGASFAYGVSGRRVLMPHLLMDLTDEAKTINTRLATQGDSPAVCNALESTGVRYVLDFSADGDFQDNPDDYSGLEGLDRSPYVTLVEHEGDAKLFKITSCGLD